MKNRLETFEKNTILYSSARLWRQDCDWLKGKLVEVIANDECNCKEIFVAETPTRSASITSCTYGRNWRPSKKNGAQESELN